MQVRPHPMESWLAKVRSGGTMILPLTGKSGSGAVFKFTRLESGFSAAFLLPITIYPCIGARDAAEEDILDRAFTGGRLLAVRSLRLDVHEPEAYCWMH